MAQMEALPAKQWFGGTGGVPRVALRYGATDRLATTSPSPTTFTSAHSPF